jgi:NADPH2:quinone reductase
MAELPSPEPGVGEVSIRVTAVALNFFDTLITRGKYQHKPPLPFSPGGEIAGVVTAVGDGVEGLRPGERVFAYVRWNGCREAIAVPAAGVTPLPDSVPDEAGAAIPITYGTALHGLEARGRLRPGETVLVLGATGGAGLAAVEIAQLLGARVIAAGSSKDKLQLCASAGAFGLLDVSVPNWRKALRDMAGGHGVDVVYDCLGGPYAEPALRAIGWGGRYLVIGFAAGEIPKIPLNLVLLKGCELTGVFWGRHVDLEPQAFRAEMTQLAAFVAEGRLRPHIDCVLPLHRTAEGLRLIEARKIKGKVVVKP